MKKLLALVLSVLLVASCMAFAAVAAEETTAAAEDATTAAEDATTVPEEETTEATSYSNTLLVFNSDAKAMKILGSPNGINKNYYNEDWEGARLKITDTGDPYVAINWNSYINRADLEKVDSQAYPFVVFKIKVEGYVDDIELFYAAGDVLGATGGYSTTTDYPCMCTGEIEYIMYDLTGDCEGIYNMFRFDPMGADEDTFVYLYEMALFATEEEAIAYAGFDQETEPETSTEAATTEPATEEESEEATTEKQPAATKPVEDKGCGGIVSIGALVAIISLGVVCIKKKD